MEPLATLNDLELIARMRENDQHAFNVIYERYWQNLYQRAWNILRDRESTLDVLQEVFTWLWDNRQNLVIENLPAYLRAAVRYKVTDLLRQNKVREASLIPIESLDKEFFSTEADPLELKELKALIAQAAAQLPERARLVFEMSRNEHLSNKEIAARLGISEKTVKNQMTIALRKLRTSMNTLPSWLFFFL